MKAFCTYCSRLKSSEPGEIPAIRRYQSRRIERVYRSAATLDFGFFILSGKFGLVPPEKCIPWYDHLLKVDEVSVLAELMCAQMREFRIEGLVYFTKPLASSTNLLPYHDCFVIACCRMSVPFLVLELEDQEMTNWRTIMEAADTAKMTMISDPTGGEKQFEALLRQYPRDGMIFFKRGEAYEALGDNQRAAADFRQAMALFPKVDWKARAREAINRVTL